MMSFSLNKILVSTDFSAAGKNALEAAISMCQKNTSELLIVHVIDNSRIHFSHQHSILCGPIQQLVRIASENLKALCASIQVQDNIVVRYKVLTGKAAYEICRLSIMHNVDLIVVGKRSTFNTASLPLGDTASQIVRLSSKPVLCVPAGIAYKTFRTILLPIQERSAALFHYRLARFISSESNPKFIVAGIARRSTLDLAPSRLIRLTELISKKIGHDGLRSTKRLSLCDDAVSELVGISNDEGADLIFVAADPTPQSRRVSFNDYATDILIQSSCPVLTINRNFLMQLN